MSGGQSKAENFLQHLEPLRGALEAYCRRSLRDQNAIPDVLQSAIASAYRDFHRYAEGTNFRAWIFRYVHLEALNWNRKSERTRHQALPAEVPAAAPAPLDESLFEALLEDPDLVLDQCDEVLSEAVRALSEIERATLLLLAVGEFKYREIADILQIPIGTVMSSLARGRLRLRHRLVHFGEERGLLNPPEKREGTR